ncbi:MAG: immune inhibitor A [Candidatus Zixiibacteriota bacterium]|nr:MAG: immune inhibitor A [candidate division Zixibacteria bacterium]
MRSSTYVIAALLAVFVLAATTLSADPPVLKLRVTLDRPADGAALRAMGFEGVFVKGNHADLFTDAEGLSRIRKARLSVEVLIEDVAAYYAEQLAEYDGMGGYKTFSEVVAYLDGMIADHPGIMTARTSIGLSIEGRDIWAVKISDNPDVNEDEPEILFHSLTHSMEPVTMEILVYFMDYLTDNYGVDPDVTYILDNREIWFVLVVNPDGYVYNEVTYPDGGGMWRKNRRDNPDKSYGVDLNRNYGYMWGYDDEGSSPKYRDGDYRGEAPFSEPETQAMRDFILAHDFEIIGDYHAAGHSFLWPYSYDLSTTPDNDVYVLLTDSMAAMSDYTASGQLLANGCSFDWHYGEQTVKDRIFGLCVEVAGGDLWPDPAVLPAVGAENVPIGMFLCRAADSVFLADSVYQLGPPNRPVVHVPEGVQGPQYTVSWQHDDVVNPASSYELMEYQGPEKIEDSANTLENWDAEQWEYVIYLYDYHSPPSAIRGFIDNGEILALKDPILVDQSEVLTFWTKYELSKGYDYVYVQVSTDGENFQSIPGNITTNDNPYGYNLGNGITGMKTHWTEAQFDLSAYEGQCIWLRFIGYAYKDGGIFNIDDIYPVMRFQTETTIASDLTDTLYTFNDKTEGDYYYRVRAKDAQNQWGELSGYGLVTVGGAAFLNAGVDRRRAGDADGSGVVDQADVAYLIEFLHKGGPAPDPIEAGDADGDGDVDGDDFKYLIEYLHKDGPEPVCP